MSRRIVLWVSIGLAIACCWVAIGYLMGPSYNPGRSMMAAITAPASLLGRRMPLGVLSFILLNAVCYGLAGVAVELLRWPYHHR